MIIAPCKDCPDRTLGCHSNCSRYLEWKADNESAKREAKRYYDKLAYTAESIKHFRKKRR